MTITSRPARVENPGAFIERGVNFGNILNGENDRGDIGARGFDGRHVMRRRHYEFQTPLLSFLFFMRGRKRDKFRRNIDAGHVCALIGKMTRKKPCPQATSISFCPGFTSRSRSRFGRITSF